MLEDLKDIIFADFDLTIDEMERCVEKLKRCKRTHNEGIVYLDRRYSLNDIEQQRYEDFETKHYNHNVLVKFEPNGIFVGIEVVCLDCDESTDITDYSVV